MPVLWQWGGYLLYNDVVEGYRVAFFTAWAIDVNIEWGMCAANEYRWQGKVHVYNSDVCCFTVLQADDAIVTWVEDGGGSVGCDGKGMVIWRF